MGTHKVLKYPSFEKTMNCYVSKIRIKLIAKHC